MLNFNPDVPLTGSGGALCSVSLAVCWKKMCYLYRALKAFTVKAAVMCTQLLSYFSAERFQLS